MPTPTQKQLLEKILEEQENARQQKQQDAIKMMQVLSDFSVQLNNINTNYLSIKETLENNIKTGKIGLINKVDKIDERVYAIEKNREINVGKWAVIMAFATTIFSVLGSFLLKYLDK